MAVRSLRHVSANTPSASKCSRMIRWENLVRHGSRTLLCAAVLLATARTEAAAPWAISFPKGNARFHVIERGDVVATVSGIKKPIRAVAGDLLMFPRGEGHTIADKPGRRAVGPKAGSALGKRAARAALRFGPVGPAVGLDGLPRAAPPNGGP